MADGKIDSLPQQQQQQDRAQAFPSGSILTNHPHPHTSAAAAALTDRVREKHVYIFPVTPCAPARSQLLGARWQSSVEAGVVAFFLLLPLDTLALSLCAVPSGFRQSCTGRCIGLAAALHLQPSKHLCLGTECVCVCLCVYIALAFTDAVY